MREESLSVKENIFRIFRTIRDVCGSFKEFENAPSYKVISSDNIYTLTNCANDHLRTSFTEMSFKPYESVLNQLREDEMDRGSGNVLRDLKLMFSEGKRLLTLNQRLQASEKAEMESERREIVLQKESLEKEKQHLIAMRLKDNARQFRNSPSFDEGFAKPPSLPGSRSNSKNR